MPYTMDDFLADYIIDHFHKWTPEQQRKALRSLSREQLQEVHACVQELLKNSKPSPAKAKGNPGKRRERKR